MLVMYLDYILADGMDFMKFLRQFDELFLLVSSQFDMMAIQDNPNHRLGFFQPFFYQDIQKSLAKQPHLKDKLEDALRANGGCTKLGGFFVVVGIPGTWSFPCNENPERSITRKMHANGQSIRRGGANRTGTMQKHSTRTFNMLWDNHDAERFSEIVKELDRLPLNYDPNPAVYVSETLLDPVQYRNASMITRIYYIRPGSEREEHLVFPVFEY